MTLPILPPETGDVKAGFFCYYVENIEGYKPKTSERRVKMGKHGSITGRVYCWRSPYMDISKNSNILPEYHNVDVDDKEIL